MKKINKIIIFSFALVTALVTSNVLTKPVMAQYYGQNQGNPKILIDKQIRPITDNIFYDNIASEQKIFTEGDTIEFKIIVENTGNETLNSVKFTDMLPKYIDLLFYPGVYNKTTNSIVTEIGTLEAGQKKEYFIRAKVVDLPTSVIVNKYFQQVNKVNVVSDKSSDYDEAKYFVAAKNVPTTGANDLVQKTLIIFGTISIAISLRRLSRGY